MLSTEHSHTGTPTIARSSAFLLVAFIAMGFAPTSSSQAPSEQISTAPVPAREVTLGEMLSFAERNAPDVTVANAHRGYARAADEGASPLMSHNPVLELGIGPRLSETGASDFDFLATLSQPIDLGGQRGARLEASRRTRARIEGEAAAVRWNVRLRTTVAFGALVIARERMMLTEQLAQFAHRTRELADRRLAAGEGSSIDVRLARSDHARARARALRSRQEFRSAGLTLCEITGWPVEDLPWPRIDSPSVEVGTLNELLERARDAHPEILRYREMTREARASESAAQRDAVPSPSIGVSVAREGSAGSPANYIVLGSVGLQIPIWQQNQRETANARATAEVAQAQSEAFARELVARIARAHSDLEASRDRIRIFDTDVRPQLDESLTLLTHAFEAGEISVVNVALARERLLSAQEDAIAANEDYYRALAELEYAVGFPLSRAHTREGGEQ